MPAKGRGIVTSGTMSRGTHIAGYELITTAPCPRTSVFRGRGNRPAGTTDDGQPPRPAPITQTAKPVAPLPTDLSGDCLAARAQDSSMSRPLSASSGSGRQHGQEPDRARSGPALRGKRRSHPNCAGCTTSRPAGSRPCHLNHPIAACRWRRGQLLGTTGQQRTGRSAPRSAALAQCRFS